MSRRDKATASGFLYRSVVISLIALFATLLAMPAGARELDPNSPPPARDYVSCGHFESQNSAQETLDSGLLDELGRQSLDGDGDGIACEGVFGSDSGTEAAPETTAGVTGLPRTGSGPEPSSNGDLFLILAGLLIMGGILVSRECRIQ